ncbi:MAG: hypothetical protein P8Q35_01770 [Candidatus Thalassarchaeaceae archaeon]|nr:hypothetical protein [Candidatus Thalassarchaeaceae archaeon]
MSDNAPYQMPPTDTSPFSLMLWCQFVFFMLMLYETSADSGPDLFSGVFVIVGLLLLMRVKNGVFGAIGVLAAAPVVFGLAEGGDLSGILMWMFWMVVFMGGMGILLPAASFREHGLKISDGARKWIIILFVCLVVGMFGAGESYDIANSGEYNDDSESLSEEEKELRENGAACSEMASCHEAGDMNVNLAWAGFAVAVGGLLIFLATAVFGVELGPLRPFHGISIAVLSAWLSAYNLSDLAGRDLPVELVWALTISGLMILPVYNFFENGEEATIESE